MNRFVSNFANRLDAKGRVSIPAPFRAVLARDGFEGLYVHPALDAPALDAGGNTLLAEIEAFLLGASRPIRTSATSSSTALYGTSEILKVDPEGRAVLTESLKSHAGIADAVAFVGLGHKFQIWEPNAFAAHLDGGADARCGSCGNPGAPGRRAPEAPRRSAGAMMGAATATPDAAGGPARHVPVLLAEVLDALAAERGGVFVDGTFGAGGYTRASSPQAAAPASSRSTAIPMRSPAAPRWC